MPKLRRRERSGRYQRRSAQDREFAPTLVHRAQEFGDPLFASRLGRLYLSGEVDAYQLQAGKLWEEMMAKYRSALGVNSVASANVQPGSHHPPDPDSPGGLAIVKREYALLRKVERARTALHSAGKPAEAAVRAVCERDEDVGYAARPWLVLGLNRLVLHWRLGRA